MKRGYRCYAQDMEVPKRIPKPEKCLYCRNHQLGCDDKKPCTKCVTRNVACNYKDGDVKWTYQTDPKEWKEPTFPTCNECVRWNGSHPSKTLTCDGKSPCNCCLEELDKATRDLTPNCTYRYENGVSKSIKLPGERAQALRMRTQWQGKLRRKAASQKYTTAEDEDLLPNNTGGKNDSQDDKGNDPSQEACASFSYPYPDKSSDHDGNDLNAGGESDKEHTTAEDEELLNEDLLPHNTGDEDDSQSYMTWSPSRESCASFSYPYPDDGSDHDRNDSDAGGESDNEHPDQDHDHDHDHRSDSRDDENSKPYNNENQKGATPRIDLLSSRSRCSISSLLGPSSPRSLESRLSQDVRTGRDPSSPDDQIERGDLDSSNQSKVPNPRDYDDEMCYRLVDEGGSQKRKRSGYGSIGGFREAFGRRRL